MRAGAGLVDQPLVLIPETQDLGVELIGLGRALGLVEERTLGGAPLVKDFERELSVWHLGVLQVAGATVYGTWSIRRIGRDPSEAAPYLRMPSGWLHRVRNPDPSPS
jgi:hypothetical protein